MYAFLQHGGKLALQVLYMLWQIRLSVCLCVNLSHSGIVSK